MIPRIATMTSEIGRVSQNAPWPAARSVKRIASVAYATDERLSLEKTASAFVFESRSADSSSLASGRPNRTRRVRAAKRPPTLADSPAASLARTTPGAGWRKYGDGAGSTMTRRSARRRPRRIGRRVDGSGSAVSASASVTGPDRERRAARRPLDHEPEPDAAGPRGCDPGHGLGDGRGQTGDADTNRGAVGDESDRDVDLVERDVLGRICGRRERDGCQTLHVPIVC